MVTGVRLDPITIGREYADFIQHVAAAERLWAHDDQGVIELFLLTSPTDAETERRLSGFVGDLIRQYPAARIRLHLLNPSSFEPGTDLHSDVAAGAQPIPLYR